MDILKEASKNPGQYNAPQTQAQPPAVPAPDPAKPVLDAVRATAGMANPVTAKTPAANPLMSADSGQGAVRLLQAGDAAMRGAGQAIADAGNAVGNAVVAARQPTQQASAPMPGNAGRGEQDTPIGKFISGLGMGGTNIANEAAYLGGTLMDKALGWNKDYLRERTAPTGTDADAFAYRGAPVQQPAPQPAPAAQQPALQPNYDAQVAQAVAVGNAGANSKGLRPMSGPDVSPQSRLPSINPYAGPGAAESQPGYQPAGMQAPGGLMGNADQQRQYWAEQSARLAAKDQAEQQARTQAAQAGAQAAQAGDARARVDAANAQANQWMEQLMALSKQPGSRQNTAMIAALSGQIQSMRGAGAQQGQLDVSMRGQDSTAATAQRGQDITAGTTRRGQDITAATTQRGQNLTYAGQQLASDTDLLKTGMNNAVTVRGQDKTAEIHQADADAAMARTKETTAANRDVHAAAIKAERSKMIPHPIMPGFFYTPDAQIIDGRKPMGMLKPQ